MKFICGNDAACLGAGWDGPEGQTFSYGCCGQKFWFVYWRKALYQIYFRICEGDKLLKRIVGLLPLIE